MKLIPRIKAHPRIASAVEFEIMKGDFCVEYGSIVESTLEKSIAKAKMFINNLYPDLDLDGIYVHVPDGR